MKKSILVLVLALVGALIPQLGMAGAAGGGSTEWTQIANNVQLGLQYAKQIDQYTTQYKQFDTQLKNLLKNPSAASTANVDQLTSGIGGLMSAGNAIGGNMAKIDAAFAKNYKSTVAASYADKFTALNKTSTDTLEGSMKAAGLYRDNYASDSAAVAALYAQTEANEGNVQALQTLSKINIAQLQQSQKLGELMASQNIAASNEMAKLTKVNQERNEGREKLMGDGANVVFDKKTYGL